MATRVEKVALELFIRLIPDDDVAQNSNTGTQKVSNDPRKKEVEILGRERVDGWRLRGELVDLKMGVLGEEEIGEEKGMRETIIMWESPPLIPLRGVMKIQVA